MLPLSKQPFRPFGSNRPHYSAAELAIVRKLHSHRPRDFHGIHGTGTANYYLPHHLDGSQVILGVHVRCNDDKDHTVFAAQ